MPTARRRVAALGTVIVMVVVLSILLFARASLGTALPLDLTPTAFLYAPVVFRDHAPSTPTPTATPTSTATPIPTHARFYLCCFDVLAETCSACWGFYSLYPDTSWAWQSTGLPIEIDGTTYEFGIAASSGSVSSLEVELYLIQDQELLLATTSFAVDSPQAERYVQIVQGIDPAVTIGEDRLMVRISNVSGAFVQIYLGDPDQAEAGGSYVEFPRSR